MPMAHNVTGLPYVVSLRYSKNMEHKCGGTILNAYWILTAAHCVCYSELTFVRPKSSIQVMSGVSDENQRITSSISAIVKHPNFTLSPVVHNVALIKLDKPLNFSDEIKPVDLPSGRVTNERDVFQIYKNPCIATGWARRKVSNDKDLQFMAVQLRLSPLAFCQRVWNVPFKTEVCSFSPGRQDCRSDSGGSLICENLQIGILSYGSGVCGKKPAVWCRLDEHIDWISEVTESEFNKELQHASSDVKNNVQINLVIFSTHWALVVFIE